MTKKSTDLGLSELLTQFEFHDLSVPMIHGAVGWSTLPAVRIEKLHHVDRDLLDSHNILINSQNYTHFDAPSHLISGGKTIDRYPARQFIQDAVALDLSHIASREIRRKDLSKFATRIRNRGAVILCTGFEKGPFEMKFEYKCLGLEGSRYLSSFNSLRIVATDALGIGDWCSSVPARAPTRSVQYVQRVHKYLMNKDILIVENVTNTKNIFTAGEQSVEGIFIALPLRFLGIEGGQCRAVFLKPKKEFAVPRGTARR